ncbi:hypothetical protein WH95_15230 [Kiloniella litopenaei]|uniref:Uracil-DNA glycosylase-like domain-containing protein n=2 Tax=Kiloniella litopenaei TaxID=1549748 RepID=A0A0M2R7X0_9PROT|nr:uracil-DNA glycosylase family protein [Kiloniella litopenaei]KKJ76105.1 hypothetical protein WH95_15230 [Kiloniella litopenaei]
MARMDEDWDNLLAHVRGCTHCANDLPLGPRPVVQICPSARILIIGQAPGTKVHETGIPWNDPSGDRLRDWLGIDKELFYDPEKIAIMPMGFCYPGRLDKGGDAPPRPECAPLWHDRLLGVLPNLRITLLVGQYAQKFYLGKKKKRTLTGTVKSWREYQPAYFVTPHPSWRSAMWLKKHPWFENDVLPVLRNRVQELL